MATTSIKCPNCGSDITVNIEALNESVKLAALDKRILALKSAGIKTDNFLAIDKDLFVNRNGEYVAFVADQKEKRIISGADIDDKFIQCQHLHKRFVTAQLLHLIINSKYDTNLHCIVYDRDEKGNLVISTTNFHNKVKGYSVRYAFEETLDRLKGESKMMSGDFIDEECFVEDNRWYNKELAVAMVNHYYEQLKDVLKNGKTRKCKGKKYIPLNCKRIVPGTEKGVFVGIAVDNVLITMRNRVNRVENATNIHELASAFEEFVRRMPDLSNCRSILRGFKYTNCKEWINAYKGFGGYHAAMSLIKDSNFRIKEYDELQRKYENDFLNMEDSLEYVQKRAGEYTRQGYSMLTIVVDMIKYNNTNIEELFAKWKKERAERNANK